MDGIALAKGVIVHSSITLAVAGLFALFTACGDDPPLPPSADVGGGGGAAVDGSQRPGGCGAWPGSAGELRAALGDRGRWTAAWRPGDPAGLNVDGIEQALALVPRGTPAIPLADASANDCAVGFDSPDDGFAATTPTTLELGASRSFAALLVLAIDGDGLLASKRAADGGAGYELAIEDGTGALQATLGDGARSVTVSIPIDHRDHAFHGVLLLVDRRQQRLRLVSDLGRSPAISIAGLGSLATSATFTLGATADRGAAAHRLRLAAFAIDGPAIAAEDADLALLALRLGTGRPPPTIRPPRGMPWVPPWPIQHQERGRFTLAVDPRSLRVPTTADLWVAPTGDDGAAGTAMAPMRSLHVAMTAMTQATTIHLGAGSYDTATGWRGVSPPYDLNVIAEGGRARLTSADLNLAWRPSPGQPGTYEATVLTGPYAVIETGSELEPWLARKSTVAEVGLAPGSWTYAAGRVTVHPRDDRGFAARIEVMPSATLNAFVDDPARSIYVEGLDLDGGYKGLLVNRARQVIVVDSGVRFASDEGVDINGTEEALVFGAIAEANGGDGLSYSTTARVLEVDCIGRGNGRDGSNRDNGSTVHSAATVVRIGGRYHDNLGPNVADVQGARSWNLGTIAGGTSATQTTQRVNFYIEGQMWLREVTATDDTSAQTTDLVTGAAAILHVHDSDYATVGGTGALDALAE